MYGTGKCGDQGQFTLTFTPGISGTLADGTAYSNFEYLSLGTGAGNDAVTFIKPKAALDIAGGYTTTDRLLSNGWNAGGGDDTVTADMSQYTTPLNAPAPAANFPGAPVLMRIMTKAPIDVDVLFLADVENYRLIGGSANDSCPPVASR